MDELKDVLAATMNPDNATRNGAEEHLKTVSGRSAAKVVRHGGNIGGH